MRQLRMKFIFILALIGACCCWHDYEEPREEPREEHELVKEDLHGNAIEDKNSPPVPHEPFQLKVLSENACSGSIQLRLESTGGQKLRVGSGSFVGVYEFPLAADSDLHRRRRGGTPLSALTKAQHSPSHLGGSARSASSSDKMDFVIDLAPGFTNLSLVAVLFRHSADNEILAISEPFGCFSIAQTLSKVKHFAEFRARRTEMKPLTYAIDEEEWVNLEVHCGATSEKTGKQHSGSWKIAVTVRNLQGEEDIREEVVCKQEEQEGGWRNRGKKTVEGADVTLDLEKAALPYKLIPVMPGHHLVEIVPLNDDVVFEGFIRLFDACTASDYQLLPLANQLLTYTEAAEAAPVGWELAKIHDEHRYYQISKMVAGCLGEQGLVWVQSIAQNIRGLLHFEEPDPDTCLVLMGLPNGYMHSMEFDCFSPKRNALYSRIAAGDSQEKVNGASRRISRSNPSRDYSRDLEESSAEKSEEKKRKTKKEKKLEFFYRY